MGRPRGSHLSESVKAYNPDQPRDEQGRWTSGGVTVSPQLSREFNTYQRAVKTWDKIPAGDTDHALELATSWSAQDRGPTTALRAVIALHTGRDPIESDFKLDLDEHGEFVLYINEGETKTLLENQVPTKVIQDTKGMYERTQEYLKSRGIKELTVYRGIKTQPTKTPDGEPVPEGKVWVPPVASWTTSRQVALSFANEDEQNGELLMMKVPAKDILLMPGTREEDNGIGQWSGYTNEQEVVVIHRTPFITPQRWKPKDTVKSEELGGRGNVLQPYFVPVVPRKISKVAKFFTLLKDLSDASLIDMENWFGPEIGALTPDDQTNLWFLMDRAGKIGDYVSFAVDNMSLAEQQQAAGGEYVVWETAEMEGTCDFCAPIDNKIVSVDEVLSMGMPPAHPNCMCILNSIEGHYGELVPVLYYYSLPFDFDTWRMSGKPPYFLGESDRVDVSIQAEKDEFDLLKEKMLK